MVDDRSILAYASFGYIQQDMKDVLLWSSFFVTLVTKKISDCFPKAIRAFRFRKGCVAPLARLSP